LERIIIKALLSPLDFCPVFPFITCLNVSIHTITMLWSVHFAYVSVPIHEIKMLLNVHFSCLSVSIYENRIDGVMVSVLASSVVDHGFETMKFLFVASLLSTQHKGKRAKTDWLGIRIMCPSGAICLSTDCCFSELEL